MDPIFVRSAKTYPTYSDFWRLVELSGFKTVGAGEADFQKAQVYIWSTLDHEFMDSFVVQSPMMLVPKGSVTASVWIATDGTESAQDKLVINFYAGDGALIGKAQGFIPVDSPFWQKVEVKADVPANAVRFLAEIAVASTKGTIWVDDFSLRGADGKEYFENGSFEK